MWFIYVFLGVMTLLAWIYMFFVFRSMLTLFVPEKRCPRIILSSFLLSGAFSLPLLTFFNGNTVYPMIALHIIVIRLLFKLLMLTVKAVFKKHSMKLLELLHRLCVVPILLTAALLCYGYYNITSLHSAEYIFESPISKDLRIVFMSDIHYGAVADYSYLLECVNTVNDYKPQLFILGGDIADENTTKAELYELFELLGKVQSKYGSYLVLGNHDLAAYSASPNYSYEEFVQAAEDSGITVLEDEAKMAMPGIYIVGRKDRSTPRKSITELTEGIDEKDFVILVDHQPVEYGEAARAGTDLLLSGHTHGGQIFPVGWITTLISPNEQNYGMQQLGDMTAIVSSGVCGWRFPFRTQHHSEFVCIDYIAF